MNFEGAKISDVYVTFECMDGSCVLPLQTLDAEKPLGKCFHAGFSEGQTQIVLLPTLPIHIFEKISQVLLALHQKRSLDQIVIPIESVSEAALLYDCAEAYDLPVLAGIVYRFVREKCALLPIKATLAPHEASAPKIRQFYTMAQLMKVLRENDPAEVCRIALTLAAEGDWESYLIGSEVQEDFLLELGWALTECWQELDEDPQSSAILGALEPLKIHDKKQAVKGIKTCLSVLLRIMHRERASLAFSIAKVVETCDELSDLYTHFNLSNDRYESVSKEYLKTIFVKSSQNNHFSIHENTFTKILLAKIYLKYNPHISLIDGIYCIIRACQVAEVELSPFSMPSVAEDIFNYLMSAWLSQLVCEGSLDLILKALLLLDKQIEDLKFPGAKPKLVFSADIYSEELFWRKFLKVWEKNFIETKNLNLFKDRLNEIAVYYEGLQLIRLNGLIRAYFVLFGENYLPTVSITERNLFYSYYYSFFFERSIAFPEAMTKLSCELELQIDIDRCAALIGAGKTIDAGEMYRNLPQSKDDLAFEKICKKVLNNSSWVSMINFIRVFGKTRKLKYFKTIISCLIATKQFSRALILIKENGSKIFVKAPEAIKELRSLQFQVFVHAFESGQNRWLHTNIARLKLLKGQEAAGEAYGKLLELLFARGYADLALDLLPKIYREDHTICCKNILFGIYQAKGLERAMEEWEKMSEVPKLYLGATEKFLSDLASEKQEKISLDQFESLVGAFNKSIIDYGCSPLLIENLFKSYLECVGLTIRLWISFREGITSNAYYQAVHARVLQLGIRAWEWRSLLPLCIWEAWLLGGKDECALWMAQLKVQGYSHEWQRVAYQMVEADPKRIVEFVTLLTNPDRELCLTECIKILLKKKKIDKARFLIPLVSSSHLRIKFYAECIYRT